MNKKIKEFQDMLNRYEEAIKNLCGEREEFRTAILLPWDDKHREEAILEAKTIVAEKENEASRIRDRIMEMYRTELKE